MSTESAPRWYAWLKTHSAVLGAVTAVVVILTTGTAVIRWALRPPDLELTAEQSRLLLPTYLTEELSASITSQVVLSDSMRKGLLRIASFIDDTRTFTTITITNNTSRSLHNVDVRIRDVAGLGGWSVGGDLLTYPELDSITVRRDDQTRVAVVSNIRRFPPRSTLTLNMWGEGPPIPYPFGDPVVATYDGGAGKLVKTTTVSGFNAFVYSNSAIILLLLVLVNAYLLSFAFGKKRPKSESEQTMRVET